MPEGRLGRALAVREPGELFEARMNERGVALGVRPAPAAGKEPRYRLETA
jgi:hypothetical protein